MRKRVLSKEESIDKKADAIERREIEWSSKERRIKEKK